jgi:hypothetical protein
MKRLDFPASEHHLRGEDASAADVPKRGPARRR